jgi:hypothetical protein
MSQTMPRGYMPRPPGHTPGLGPAAEPSRCASMPTAAGRANWGARFTLNCAGLAHWQVAHGLAHRLRCACARRLSCGACVPRLLGACAAAPARLLEPVIFAPRLGACARSALAPAPSCLKYCLIPV